jgi:N utilization substance protein A
VIVVDPQARVAQVIVPDYQLSLAIGKEGQNARLAARLTGWKIDIRPDTATDSPDAPPTGDPAAPGTAAEAAREPAEGGIHPAGAAGAGHGAADAPAR